MIQGDIYDKKIGKTNPLRFFRCSRHGNGAASRRKGENLVSTGGPITTTLTGNLSLPYVSDPKFGHCARYLPGIGPVSCGVARVSERNCFDKRTNPMALQRRPSQAETRLNFGVQNALSRASARYAPATDSCIAATPGVDQGSRHEKCVANLVPEVRFELTHPQRRRILNPLRLPFRHSGTGCAYQVDGARVNTHQRA